MQAVTATANTIAMVSLSAVMAVPASQRSRTSTTVTPAATSIPSTPMNAIGRVTVTQNFSSRSSRKTVAAGDLTSVMESAPVAASEAVSSW